MVDNTKPLFSVIMACYNSEPYIAEAIRSVLDQTISDWELIIVDDASTDNSYDLVKSFADNESRIKLIHAKSNQGPAAARNAAVENSNGKWLAILDADDIFFPNKLEKQKAFITSGREKKLVLLGTGVILFGDDAASEKKYIYPAASKKLKSNLFARKKFPPHSSMTYSSCAFKAVGGFNVRYLRAQDHDLWLRLSVLGSFASLREPLVKYRLHPSRISVNACMKGFQQKTYGTAASVCRLVRQQGMIDPSNNDSTFEELLSFIEKKYSNSMHKKLDALVLRLKNHIRSRSWLEVVYLILRHPLVLILFGLNKTSFFSFEKSVAKDFLIYSKRRADFDS